MAHPRLAAASVVLGAALCAQSPKPPQIIFRTSTQLVQINVVVDGKAGPMAGLKASDFTLTDNGKRRPVQVFSFDDERGAAAPKLPPPEAPAPSVASAPAAALRSAAPAAVFGNAAARAPGMVVVLLDAHDSPDGVECVNGIPAFSSSHSMELAKNGALAYLARLDSRAQVALYGLDTRLHVLSDFTTNRARLLALLRAYRPATPVVVGDGSEETDVPGDFNAMNAGAGAAYTQTVTAPSGRMGAAQALQAIAHHLAGQPGRISLVWFMTSPPLTGAAIEAAVANDNVAVYPVDERGLMAREPTYAQGLAPACGTFRSGLGASRLTVQPSGQAAMEDIAQATGGRAYYNTNDFGGAIAAAAADSMASYTLGFYLEASELDNTLHRLRVRVRAKGVAEVRYPHGYWALRSASNAPPSAAALDAALTTALESPLDAAGLRLKAQVTRSGADAVLVSATLGVQQLRLSPAGGLRTGAVMLATAVYDVNGRMIESSRRMLRMNFTTAEYQARLASGVQFQQTIELAPTAASVRLVAVDAGSASAGSLLIPLDAVP